MPARRFAEVDVFSAEPFRGNPLAVVVDGDGVAEDAMQAFARWTNLSETTFLLPPTTPDAEYRVRIFTPDGELPFAGHPTLGSAHAWREAGGTPREPDRLVQECAVGLVELRRTGDRWAFAGPRLTRYEPLDADTLVRVTAGLRLAPGEVLDSSWLVNGPRWLGLRLASAERVLDVRPDFAGLGGLDVGLVGPWLRAGASGDPGAADVEVRAFVGGGYEDPVTGSLNAGIARWLRDTGQVAESYVAAQGTALHRAGRVHVTASDAEVWVAGDTTTLVSGTVVI